MMCTDMFFSKYTDCFIHFGQKYGVRNTIQILKKEKHYEHYEITFVFKFSDIVSNSNDKLVNGFDCT